MIEISLAQDARPTTAETADLEHVSGVLARTVEPVPGYALRGIGLFELHDEGILAGYLGGGKWLIPSGTVAGRRYEVRVGVRRPSLCECVGHRHHGHCSHVVAAELARKKSAVCDCCGERRWDRELVEVQEEDGLLSWYPGDRLCRGCVPRFWA